MAISQEDWPLYQTYRKQRWSAVKAHQDFPDFETWAAGVRRAHKAAGPAMTLSAPQEAAGPSAPLSDSEWLAGQMRGAVEQTQDAYARRRQATGFNSVFGWIVGPWLVFIAAALILGAGYWIFHHVF